MEDIKDTTLDSWDSGDNQPDSFDNVTYNSEPQEEPVPDEGDENNLGVPIREGAQDIDDLSTVDDDVVKLDEELLDDSNYNDSTFDCD